MKKTLKVLGIILFSVFLLVPLKTNAKEPAWSNELNLTDAVSSSLIKVDDGIIVMQYEGTASTNNLLIKYDFEGNKVWEVNNEYGYNIKAVTDGFIVWNVENMTKFDLDKNVIWTKAIYSYIGNELIEVSDGYIIYDSGDQGRPIIKINFNGELINKMSPFNVHGHYEGDPNQMPILHGNINYNTDEIFFLVYYQDENNTSLYIPTIRVYNADLEFQREYKYGSIEHVYNDYINKIIAISENSYIAIGSNEATMLLKADGTTKILDKKILDIEKVEDYLYAYSVINTSDTEEVGNDYYAAITKYDLNFKEISSLQLPLNFKLSNHSYSGMFSLKGRSVYYTKDNDIYSVVLNSPLTSAYTRYSNDVKSYQYGTSYTIDNDKYNVASYRLNDSDEDNNTNDDISNIINNIIKNPQTNSIIIILIFVALIMIVSAVSYKIYKRKKKVIK